MNRPHRLRALLLSLVLVPLAAGCVFGPATGAGGTPPCPSGKACTDAAGQAGVCDGTGCVVPCALGQASCCHVNRECQHASGLGPGQVAYCEDTTGTCLVACQAARDCATLTHVGGDCHGGGCLCDEGLCVTPPCSADADCAAGQRCVAGTCGPGLTATACEVLPGPVAVAPGTRRPLTALASDGAATGRPAAPFTWSSSDPQVAAVDPVSGEVTGGDTAGDATITAATGGAGCSVTVHNLGATAAGDLRVMALDPGTHAGLPGITVVVRQGGAEQAEGTTGADGVATLTGVPAGPVAVDVLDLAGPDAAAPNGRTWVTLAGVSARTLLVPLAPNPDPEQAGGVRGSVPLSTFDALSSRSVHMALAGFSWPGALDALDLRRLTGPFTPTSFDAAGQAVKASFYSGLELGIGNNLLTPGYAPVGVPGRRVLWALVGNTRLTRWLDGLAPYLPASAQQTMRAGALASGLVPDLDTWGYTGFTRPSTAVAAQPLASGTADLAHFPAVPVTPGPRLRHAVTVALPSLPALPTEAYADALLAIPGVLVDGQGFTPLGMNLGVDVVDPTTETPNGVVDGADGLPDGEMAIRWAPRSAGLEAERPVLLLEAGTAESLAGGAPAADAARSTRLVPLSGLAFGATVDASAPLLPIPTAAAWDKATRTATGTFPDGATLHRFTLTDGQGHRWVVLAPAGQGSVTLPDASARCAGGRCVDPAAAPSQGFAEALVLESGLAYDDLLRLDGADLDRLPRLAVETARREMTLR